MYICVNVKLQIYNKVVIMYKKHITKNFIILRSLFRLMEFISIDRNRKIYVSNKKHLNLRRNKRITIISA